MNRMKNERLPREGSLGRKSKKGIIKEIIAEEEGMAHVLENLNNVEIKMRPLSYHREGAINLLY